MTPHLWAFLLFSIVTAGTPGPNNVMVSAAAANHGLRATIPHILGISIGFAAMIMIVGTGLAGPLTRFGTLHEIMRWIGIAWMLYLAWKIAVSKGSLGGDGGNSRPPLSFIGAVLFQWINPKAWLIALATAATYTTSDGNLYQQVAVLSLISFVVCLPCVLGWAAMGAGARRYLTAPRHLRAFNFTMAGLLVASLVPMLQE